MTTIQDRKTVSDLCLSQRAGRMREVSNANRRFARDPICYDPDACRAVAGAAATMAALLAHAAMLAEAASFMTSERLASAWTDLLRAAYHTQTLPGVRPEIFGGTRRVMTRDLNLIEDLMAESADPDVIGAAMAAVWDDRPDMS